MTQAPSNASAAASAGGGSPLSSSRPQRYVRHPKTLGWVKDAPGEATSTSAVAPASVAAQQHVVATQQSALEYFLSTSPTQKKYLSSRQHSNNHGASPIRSGTGGSLSDLLSSNTTRGEDVAGQQATKRVIKELDVFERRNGDAATRDDDDLDEVGSPLAVRRDPLPLPSPRTAAVNSNTVGGNGSGRRGGGGVGAATSPGTTTANPQTAVATDVRTTSPHLHYFGAGGDYHVERSLAQPQYQVGPQETTVGKRIPVVSSNPITGLLCNVPLHRIFAAYRDQFVKAVRARRASQSVLGGGGVSALATATAPSRREPLRLTLDDFREMLRALIPDESELLSDGYLRRILEPFATVSAGGGGTYGGGPKVLFPVVFSYLCKCYGHPQVERNIKFILRALDTKGRGWVPYSVLVGRVVRAWAENRVVGGAIFAWRAFAAALEAAGDVDVRLLENTAQISKDELRIIAYTTPELTETLSTMDLECDVTSTPRFPALPQAQRSDDASSMHSGRLASGRHRLL